MEPKKISFFVLIGVVPLLLIAVATGDTDQEAETEDEPTMAERVYQRAHQEMDDGTFPLRMDRSEIGAAISYMDDMQPDELSRSPSGNRRVYFEMRDGSRVVFVFEEKASGGLGYSYITTEDRIR